MNRLRTVALALLVVLAGCSGGADTTTAPGADQIGVTDAGPVESPGGETDAQRVNETALIRSHVGQLTGHNHTVTVRQRIGSNATRFDIERSARGVPSIVEFGATEQRNYTTVFTGDDVVQRRTAGGETQYRRPDTEPDDIPTSREFIAEILGDARFYPNGTVQSGGEPLARLSADRSDLTRDVAADVLSFNADLLVTEAGLVREAGYMLVVERGGERETLELTVSVTDIDRTRPTAPAWLETALAELGPPLPPGETSRTLSDTDLGATMTVVGSESAVETADLRAAPDRLWTDAVETARASPVVRASASERLSNATITLQYDESRVPESDERGLWVFVYNGTYDTYLQMATTIDPNNDTVRATRIHPAVSLTVDGETVDPRLNGLPNDTAFVVMHAETYFRNR